MNCPYCGGPMRRGHAELSNTEGILRIGVDYCITWYPDDPADGGDYVDLELPSKRFLSAKRVLGEAWYCRRCGKALCVMPTRAGPQEGNAE